MRTTTAAASAVTSTPPLIPQPDLNVNNQQNRKENSQSTAEKNAGESNILLQDRTSTPSMFPMNPADMLVAYSSTVGLNINATTSVTENEKSSKIHASETGALETSYNATTAASVSSMLEAAGFGKQPSDLSENTRRIWKDLEDYIERNLEGVMAAQRGDPGSPSEETVTELQLQTARTLRQVLPANRDLLHLVQEKNWMKMLLEWLNYDRPAVQVEALLALTNIADLCQQSYHRQQAIGSTPIVSKSTNTNLVPHPNGVGKGSELQQNLQAGAPDCVPSQNPYAYPAFPWDCRSQNTPLTQNDIGSHASAVEGYFPTFMNGIEQTSGGTFTQYEDLEPEIRTKNNEKKSENASKSEIVTDDLCSTDTERSTSRQASKGNSNSFPFGASIHHAMAVTTSQLNNPNYNNLPQPAVISGIHPHMLNNLPVSLSQLPSPCDSNGKDTSNAPTPLTTSAPPTFVTAFNSSFSIPQQRLSMPPPPAISSAPMVGSFPQPLSTSSQHLLLRHRDTIPTLVSLLSSPNREVHEQAMWILGSIVTSDPTSPPNNTPSNGGSSLSTCGGSGNVDMGDKIANISAKEAVLAAGVMAPLLNCLEANPHNLSLQRIGSWALSNLVETKIQQGKSNKPSGSSNVADNPIANEVEINLLLPTLQRLLNSSDHEVLSYTCWALSHLCDGPSSNIAAVVTSSEPRDVPGGLVPRLVDLLLHRSWKVTKPALRTIGNIVCAECGDELHSTKHGENSNLAIPTDFTEVILDCNAVPRLKLLITHGNREIQKEACWTLSNIAAGTVDQIQAVIESEAISPLVKLVNDKNTDQEVRSEACWVVLNATSCGSDQQIEVLVAEGCVSVLGLLLEDASMASMALEGLERVLQVEEHREATRRVRAQMRRNSDSDDDSEGLPPSPLVNASLIKKVLEKHNSNSVLKCAERIWNNHFVYCKLCRQSFSKHRTSDAKFCDECKCYVCSKCNCEIYHLSYQEKLWAASEEKKEATKRAKKSKRQKRKEKRKEKNKTKQQEAKAAATSTNSYQCVPVPDDGKKQSQDTQISSNDSMNAQLEPCLKYVEVGHEIEGVDKGSDGKCTIDFGSQVVERNDDCVSVTSKTKPRTVTKVKKKDVKQFPKKIATETETIIATQKGSDNNQPPVDFVLYLQQTGSIIELARLMDALDEGNGPTYDGDTDIDRLSALKPQSTFT